MVGFIQFVLWPLQDHSIEGKVKRKYVVLWKIYTQYLIEHMLKREIFEVSLHFGKCPYSLGADKAFFAFIIGKVIH